MDPAEAIQCKLSRSFIIRILAHAVKDPGEVRRLCTLPRENKEHLQG